MSNPVTFQEIVAFTSSFGGAFASAWSDGAKRYTLEAARVLQESGQQVLTETQKFDIFVMQQAKTFQNVSDTAHAWAEAAEAAGKTGIADIMRKYGDKAFAEADKIYSGVIDKKQWLDAFVADANIRISSANHTIAQTGGVVGKTFGPIVDAASMVDGAWDYSQTGDTTHWENACYGVGLSWLLGGAAAVLAPIGFSGVLAIAVAAGVGSYLGSTYAQSMTNWLLQNETFTWAFDHTIGPLITSIQSLVTQAVHTPTPLILDLNGDGVQTTGLSENVHFDHDGNGFAEQTGWAAPEDGLLVLDRNGNGAIDDGGELFGDHTALATGARAANGFEALAELDGNADGKVDASDAAFATLKVWMDANQDGITDSGELLTLEQAGVQSLGTGYSNSMLIDGNGNSHKQVGTFTRTDNSTADMTDVWFVADMARTIDKSSVVITGTIAALPEVAAFGNVHSLHKAMALDVSGDLQSLVTQWIASDEVVRAQTLDSLIYTWAGVDSVAAGSRGSGLDARKLAVVEALMGQGFVQLTAGEDPAGDASVMLSEAYLIFSDYVQGQLLLQTDFKPWVDAATLSFDSSGVSLDVSGMVAMMEALYIADVDKGIQTMGVLGRALVPLGGFGDEILQAIHAASVNYGDGFGTALANMGGFFSIGTQQGDYLVEKYVNIPHHVFGFEGDDHLTSSSNADHLYGGAGNDLIDGGDGADMIYGGVGNDTLIGGDGADTYFFNAGDGVDTISGTRLEFDTLVLGAGLTPAAATIEQTNFDLILRWGSDVVTVKSYFFGSAYQVQSINFDDGTQWGVADVMARLVLTGTEGEDYLDGSTDYINTIQGLGGDDHLTGGNCDDTIAGGSGIDQIIGNAGNDTLTGGLDDDSLNGGAGNDIYVFNAGDGHDTILDVDYSGSSVDVLRLGAGLTPENTNLSYENYSLKLSWGVNDSVSIQNFFSPSSFYLIENIEFADGALWCVSDLTSRVVQNGTEYSESMSGFQNFDNHLSGHEGNDTLYGGQANDVLEGGSGNDQLYAGNGTNTLIGGTGSDILNGGTGNDTFIFNVGDGSDVIRDCSYTPDSIDVLQLGEMLTPQATFLTKKGSTLLLSWGADSVLLENALVASQYQIEQIKFHDGTTLTSAELVGIAEPWDHYVAHSLVM